MDKTPDEKFLEDLTREAIETSKARRKLDQPGIPAERVRAMIVELERRCTEAGKADPAIAQELCEKLKRGESF